MNDNNNTNANVNVSEKEDEEVEVEVEVEVVVKTEGTETRFTGVDLRNLTLPRWDSDRGVYSAATCESESESESEDCFKKVKFPEDSFFAQCYIRGKREEEKQNEKVIEIYTRLARCMKRPSMSSAIKKTRTTHRVFYVVWKRLSDEERKPLLVDATYALGKTKQLCIINDVK